MKWDSARLSVEGVRFRSCWLARWRRTLFVGLGSIAACWHWLRWGGRTRHQRYQVEEHQRRKRLQAHPTFKQLEHRGSPGVPVDPAAMLLAGYTGLAIMPHQLLQAPLPAVVEQPTGSGTPRRALADDERRPAGAAPAVTITAANAPRANVSAAPSTASTDTDNTAVTNPDPRLWRPLQPLLGRQDVLPEMFPATEHLGPDGDSSQPLPAPLPGGGGGVLLDTPSITPASTPAPLPPGPQAQAPAAAPPAPTAASASGSSSTPASPTVSSNGIRMTVPSAPLSPSAASAAGLPAEATGSIRFELNEGQVDPQVRFLTHGGRANFFLTDQQAVLDVRNDTSQPVSSVPRHVSGTVLRTQFVGAVPAVQPIGLGLLPGTTNYLIGNDPSQWQTNVPSYAGVEYPDLYPGINLIYYGNAQGQLEYDFVVAAQADPSAIHLQIQGADRLSLDSQGNLVQDTARSGALTQSAPRLYQVADDGSRQSVAGRFVLGADGAVAFGVGPYDRTRPLHIDPALLYSVVLGGTLVDSGSAIAVDGQSSMYVAGITYSTDFPTTTGAYQQAFSTPTDAFITKLGSGGFGYSTYLGAHDGTGNPPPPSGTGAGAVLSVGGIALGSGGDAYITGSTNATTFPTTAGALQSTLPSRASSGFISQLDATGSGLVYSSYLGGTKNASGAAASEAGTAIAVDANGQPIVAGYTDATDFPVNNPYQSGNAGGQDAFMTQFSGDGTTLPYSTYLGGGGTDQINAIALSGDTAYVTGFTQSSNFPVTSGAYQSSYTGNESAFMAQISTSGALSHSTYLGDSNSTSGNAIALDGSGNAYLSGWTKGTNFPTTSGAFQSAMAGNQDAFVAELNGNGTSLLVGTYLGGLALDSAVAVGVDPQGNIAVAGTTNSTNFPTAAAFQTSGGGNNDLFVTKLQSNGAMLWNSYLGGGNEDDAYAGTVDDLGNLYLTGYTAGGFPVTATLPGDPLGGGDAFAAEVQGLGAIGQYRSDDPLQSPPDYVPWGMGPNGSPGGEFNGSPQTGDMQLTQGLDLLQHCPDS